MLSRSIFRTQILFGLFLLSSFPILHSSFVDDSSLIGAFGKALREVSYGVSSGPTFILKKDQIASIRFSGSGKDSRYSYVKQSGILNKGLYLNLVNEGDEGWANGLITFKTPLDIQLYNSIVIWIRSDKPNRRVRVGLQDKAWKAESVPQARTANIPWNGMPANDIIQLVIPYSSIFSEGSVDLSSIARVDVEFGRYTVGNRKAGTIEVLGLAFIRQGRALKNVKMVVCPIRMPEVNPPEMNPPPQTGEGLMVSAAADARSQEMALASMTAQGKSAVSIGSETVKTTEARMIRIAARIKKPIFDSARQARTLTFAILKNPWVIKLSVVFLGLFGASLLLIVLWKLLSKRRQNWIPQLPNVLFCVDWPTGSPEFEIGPKIYRSFWKNVARKKISRVWAQPYHASHDFDVQEEYLGENFLIQQIRTAKVEGVELIPTVCFVRSLFVYGTFMAHPDLFVFKPVPQSDYQLSDEELRIKHMGYFPLWVPPFWQKQHGLAQRVLAAYGKMPGFPFTNDSVQYNLNSPAHRAMAIRVLKRLASLTRTVRIEGAASLLNSSLSLYWGEQLPGEGRDEQQEFWTGVLSEVKSSYPQFQLIADGVGWDRESILNVGFDFFENDYLRETLVNQIKMETVGRLPQLLDQSGRTLLKRSIYNLNPLLSNSPKMTSSDDQRILGAALLSLLPGKVTFNVDAAGDFFDFLKTVGRLPILIKGDFQLLSHDQKSLLAFARYFGKSLLIVVANFSPLTRTVNLPLDPFLGSIDDHRLYLFNDQLYGNPFLKGMGPESLGPALAISGQDIREAGLALKLSGLSLKVLSVNLSRPITLRRLSSKGTTIKSS
ncbi:MAG: hypothetical protein LHV69_09440 [Elusimicrobia bacterium]|nr:hypothetical protein [Candidatus Obscuribacterium magneticum]